MVRIKILNNASVNRLAKKAGIKSMSQECAELIMAMIEQEVKETTQKTDVISKGKIITKEDLQLCLSLQGKNIAVSEKLGNKVIGKLKSS